MPEHLRHGVSVLLEIQTHVYWSPRLFKHLYSLGLNIEIFIDVIDEFMRENKNNFILINATLNLCKNDSFASKWYNPFR